MIARLLAVSLSLASFANAFQPEIQVTTAKPALGDNLALNLADAVIKSIFPEVEEVKNPRRAPINPLIAGGSSPGYSQYSSGAYPIPPGNILPSAGFPGARFQGRTDLPGSYIYPYASPGSVVQPNVGNGQPFFLGPQGLEQFANAQNQQYLTQLQNQQQPLQTQQQLYLQQQLLQQAQQQQLLQGPTQQYLSAGRQQQFNPFLTRQYGTLALPEHLQPQLPIQSQGAAEDNLSTQFGSSSFAQKAANTSVKSSPKVNDVNLEEFFKSYGVDLSRSQSQLTTDDNATLAILKERLTQQQRTTQNLPFITERSENSNESVLEQIEKSSQQPSTFTSPTTRFSLLEKETVTDAPSTLATKVTSRPPVTTSDRSTSCGLCIPIDLAKVVGPWTQIYGNPDILRQIYTTVQSIQDLELTSDMVTAKMASVQPSCIGFQLDRPNQNTMAMNLFFRDDSKGRKLHEMTGTLKQDNETNILDLMLSMLNMPMCAVMAGPTDGELYEYLVLTETTGVNRCRSNHVFARNTETFFRDHNSDIADFMEMEVSRRQSLPVAVLPFPRLCQLPTVAR